MKAVIPHIPDYELARRRAWGADRWDEVWEGVLHMLPPPRIGHQRSELQLLTWLTQYWESERRGRVFHQVAVSPLEDGWVDDYRVPDISLVTADRDSIERETHLCGGPTVAVELRSPHDETYEKFDFYAELEVAELWILDVATKSVELYELAVSKYTASDAAEDGWLTSPRTGIELRSHSNYFEIRLSIDHTTTTKIQGK